MNEVMPIAAGTVGVGSLTSFAPVAAAHMGMAAAPAIGRAAVATGQAAGRFAGAAHNAAVSTGRVISKPINAVQNAYTHAGQTLGAAVATSQHGDKMVKGVTHAMQLAEPFIVPGPPAQMSFPGLAGAVAKEAIDQYKKATE
ncbi:hypothetical protein LJB93_03555 [Desulfovibrio sp. OttesenSCG-928-F07]|nr:hypothetical protein [Desulfovibrio sp. OttesenSCG-928-F07]